MRFAAPRTFKKKCHEQQYKHDEKVKNTVTEAKAILARKQDACIAKLEQDIELIDGRQTLILMADPSDFGWKPVGEYLDNELADNDEDAKKKAEKKRSAAKDS